MSEENQSIEVGGLSTVTRGNLRGEKDVYKGDAMWDVEECVRGERRRQCGGGGGGVFKQDPEGAGEVTIGEVVVGWVTRKNVLSHS